MSAAMGRTRGGRFRDRPENVEIATVRGTTYFSYVFPDGRRKAIGNSQDTNKAFETARMLNGHFAQLRNAHQVSHLLAPPTLPTPRNPLIPTLIQEFKQHSPKRKKYSERTLSEQDYRLTHYAEKWGDKAVSDIDTLTVSGALNQLTDNAYVKHRADLLNLFQFAGHQGYITTNPVAITLIKSESAKVRQRHTWAGVQKILEVADPFLHRAIRIALYSLQRRDDLVHLHKLHNQVSLEANTLTVLQRKTRQYKNPVWIEIEMGPELRQAVEECLRSEIPCPYLIHRRPQKMPKRREQTKLHPFAVTAGYLTKEFKRARDACHAYDHLPMDERPTLHELRALGTHLYEQAGYSDEYIMSLSGHAKKETLERYKRDHAGKAPRRVSAGITTTELNGVSLKFP